MGTTTLKGNLAGSSKMENAISYIPVIPFLGIYSKEMFTHQNKRTCARMFYATNYSKPSQ